MTNPEYDQIKMLLNKIEQEQTSVSQQLLELKEGMKALLKKRINEYNLSSSLSEPVEKAKECPHWTNVDKDCGLNNETCNYPNCLK